MPTTILILLLLGVLLYAVVIRSGRTGRLSDRGVRAVGSRSRTPNTTLRSAARRPSAKPDYAREPLPTGLGLLPGIPLQAAEERLERAMDVEFQEQLKKRVLAKHPSMSGAEFDWKLLELKRYFMMNTILRTVPMFSDAVDDIWHEMLMFTREYQRFGQTFLGAVLHHAPHAESVPMPGERAWFDWVYAHLFKETPFSSLLWNGFFRYPLDSGLVERLQRDSEPALTGELFNEGAAARFPEIAQTISLLISLAKDQLRLTTERREYDERRRADFGRDSMMPYMAGAMLFYSAVDPGGYNERMDETADTSSQDSGGGSGASADSSSSSGCSSSGDSSSSCGSGCGGGS